MRWPAKSGSGLARRRAYEGWKHMGWLPEHVSQERAGLGLFDGLTVTQLIDILLA